MKNRICFVHTSPAAIPPLMQFYGTAAPDLEITNLLDDGLLRMFAHRDFELAEARLREMLHVAKTIYGAELAMLTCSAVPETLTEKLCNSAGIPVFKIDVPMAKMAVRSGRRIGVAVTFVPTLEVTTELLRRAAAEASVAIETMPCVMPEAYDALLRNDLATHDELLLAGVDRLAQQRVDVIVLAQVSMARVLDKLRERTSIPVLSSLPTSLTAIRELLGGAEGKV